MRLVGGSLRRRVARICVLTLSVVAMVTIGIARPAAAHVDFLGSTPADSSSATSPVTVITLRFSGTADPITNDFKIVTQSGESATIESVVNADAKTVVVTASRPLPAGRNDVVWALRGADGHRLTGTVGFTIAAGADATPTTSGTPTTAAAASADASTSPSIVVISAPSSDSTLADAITTIARWLVYVSILFCIGALVYLLWVQRGSRSESRRLVFYVRRAALVVVIGSVIAWFAELAARGSSLAAMVSPTEWCDLLDSGFGFGTLLRLVGGVLVLRFMTIEIVDVDPAGTVDARSVDLDQLLEVDSGSLAVRTAPSTNRLTRVRVESAPLVAIGAIALVASESFIGHTASVEPRALVIVSDAIHLVAAAVWSSGVLLLALTFRRRRRTGDPTDARLVATRFSLAATISLIAVSVTGIALSIAILDGPSNLFGSTFGQVLIIKVALVAAIGFAGLHTRRVLLPELEAGASQATARFARVMAFESALFIAVLLATSILVVSSPS